ncbi:MAG TPA: hypothetical protein VFX76_02780 [Roseiflexaceae bacterium]|nr:hypothetical protein [Roseiflexaceae bacterium]
MRPTTYQWHYTLKRRLAIAWRVIWPVFRQTLGWLFILLGLIGLVLPLLQGVVFLVIGIALVGRRHPLIRRTGVLFKLFLRRWAALETPLIGRLGRLALRGQQEISRQRRRMHWWYVERRRAREHPYASNNERIEP